MSWLFSRRPSASTSSDLDDVVTNLRWLEATLQDGRAWLDGVEAQVTVDDLTKHTKKEIKDWVYDAEDVLDEWKFEQLRAEAEPPPAPSFGRRYARDPVAELLQDRGFQNTVNKLKKSCEEIGKYNRVLRLEGAPRRLGKNVDPPPTSSLFTEREIHGREDDTEKLVGFLLDEAVKDKWSVVPVSGPEGVGKTALLQHIYNDERVSQHFNLRAWMSASGGPRMTELMKETAESVTGVRCNSTQLGTVQNLLKREIDGRRFLLVFDDVRYETIDGAQWDNLSATFTGCARGSVVILTTQEERVAEITKKKKVEPYMLESLSGDIFWSVFRKHASPGSDLPTDAHQLQEIGHKIGKECQGLPSVAKALGKFCHERDIEISDGLFSQRDVWDEVLPQLKLTYHRLPPHLKSCFVYCSMFPRGYLFIREELVRLWMAQGFVKEEWRKSLEDVGMEYFDALLTKSFFQRSELDAGAFVMPKLIHDLAQSISDGECVTTEYNNIGDIPLNTLQKARHLSLTPGKSELPVSFPSTATNLRSFLVVPAWPLKNIAQISLPDSAFHSLTHLRTLDLRHTDIRALPNTISKLKHLRYLNLSGTKIVSVDVSVFQLYNLQTLDLSYTEIRELPDTVGNLHKLLHLGLNVTKITKLPESISKLSQLQTLQLGLTEIQELPETIGGLKCLRFLCLNVSKIRRLPMSVCDISNLWTLELQGAYDDGSDNDVISNDRALVEQFSPQNDQILHNQGVGDMADSSIHSHNGHVDDGDSSSNDAMRKGNMSENQQSHVNLKCMTLPQLGQLQLLKELFIDGISVEQLGNEFCGSSGRISGFPKLEKLSFQNMCKWKEWDEVKRGDFPHLSELIIFNCPSLKGVPCLHSPLTKLKVERCAVESIPVPDSLEELELLACDNLVAPAKLPSLSSLSNLTLMYCKNLTSLPSVSSLDSLWIEECENLDMSFLGDLKIDTLSSTTFVLMDTRVED